MTDGLVPRLGAIVLAGGQSRRMGFAKALLPFGDAPLLERVVRSVAEAAWPIVVVAARDQILPPLPEGVLCARDAVPDRGPLEGLRAGLEAIGSLADAVFVASTDAPFLAPALIRLLATLRAGHGAAVPRISGREHPLAAVYDLSIRTELDDALAKGRLAVRALVARIDALMIDEVTLLADPAFAAADPSLRSFVNVNTPEEYEAALSELARRD